MPVNFFVFCLFVFLLSILISLHSGWRTHSASYYLLSSPRLASRTQMHFSSCSCLTCTSERVASGWLVNECSVGVLDLSWCCLQVFHFLCARSILSVTKRGALKTQLLLLKLWHRYLLWGETVPDGGAQGTCQLVVSYSHSVSKALPHWLSCDNSSKYSNCVSISKLTHLSKFLPSLPNRSQAMASQEGWLWSTWHSLTKYTLVTP